MKRIIIYMGHPAHFHLFKNTIILLKEAGHDVKILIKKKDILEDLLKNQGWDYTNIHSKERGDSRFKIALALLKRELALLKIVLQYKPHLMAGTSAEITHIGKITRIPSIVVNEDDADVVPLFAKVAYPMATTVLAPHCCDCGKWNHKKTGYDSYHELAYLHPNHFHADESIVKKYIQEKDFIILRFAKLNAHHDEGRKGIDDALALKLIELISPYGRVYITSERELSKELEPYRISINPLHIHHAMAFAKMYIGDSQTMAAEAAVLGTPSIRFNDFVGEIGYLEELEHKYQLTFGIRTSDREKLFETTKTLIEQGDLKEVFKLRKETMLKEKTDLSILMKDLFLKYCKA
ncbi:MAG: DUF354 domain-containing protein [Bacteroidota bacterium]|jgi:predicted glycosyltransferase